MHSAANDNLDPIRSPRQHEERSRLRYFTVIIRADRFSEGALLNAFESGLVSTSLHRVPTHPASRKLCWNSVLR
ncbi:DUF6508 domain-containing protein [Rhodococcus sp. 1163]|uniref:DUF6508 domain-containing protein n=1 Tax=Rhodococcus sp. 1163 TaxID=1905289 RepID=UPI00356B774B